MSASPVARQVTSQAIPMSRRVVITHESELPGDLSSTPGGSLFSTTPGGTRVYYDRNFMLSMRNSPLARTPPANLPVIPGVTVPENRPKKIIEDETEYRDSDEDEDEEEVGKEVAPVVQSPPTAPAKEDDDQFQLDL
ncbi:Eukaryotic translation initiation factor 4E binding [Trinorchestia longiramus]|nr:Eukaryotic translation initiation factor 4E binding [Trinorchestia longiramus]